MVLEKRIPLAEAVIPGLSIEMNNNKEKRKKVKLLLLLLWKFNSTVSGSKLDKGEPAAVRETHGCLGRQLLPSNVPGR